MSDSRDIEARIRETAEKLLAAQEVSLFLGYEKASLPFRTAPLFLGKPEEAGRLAWNPFCTANLAVYLPRLYQAPASAREARSAPPPPRVAIVVKACDARSVIALAQERQVPRDRLVIVEVACSGMVDRRKAERSLGGHEALGAGEDARGNIRVVVEDGTELTLRRADLEADACRECGSPVSAMHDIIIGTPGDGRRAATARPRTAEIESLPLDARWRLFRDTFSTCIRCNACRQACPMCYCRTCLFDQTKPRWVGAGADSSDVALYHLVRAFHTAGRCTGCGACARACPMGIDVRLLIRKMSIEAEELFGYRPGEAIDATPVLSSFTMEDPQDFVTEP